MRAARCVPTEALHATVPSSRFVHKQFADNTIDRSMENQGLILLVAIKEVECHLGDLHLPPNQGTSGSCTQRFVRVSPSGPGLVLCRKRAPPAADSSASFFISRYVAICVVQACMGESGGEGGRGGAFVTVASGSDVLSTSSEFGPREDLEKTRALTERPNQSALSRMHVPCIHLIRTLSLRLAFLDMRWRT